MCNNHNYDCNFFQIFNLYKLVSSAQYMDTSLYLLLIFTLRIHLGGVNIFK